MNFGLSINPSPRYFWGTVSYKKQPQVSSFETISAVVCVFFPVKKIAAYPLSNL